MLNRIVSIGLFIVSCAVVAGLVGGMIAGPAPTALATPTAAKPRSAPITSDTTNPVVEPGKVRWHATTAAALDAAKVSKKPVLVFQMMGELDHQFC